MADSKKEEARIFPVETRFQRMARRAGGASRDRAIENAQSQVEKIKTGFDEWLDGELQKLADAIKRASGNATADWIDDAIFYTRQLHDVGTTMDFELLTFIAKSLSEVLDAIAAGSECNMESITCHIDALVLARQKPYRGLKPEQVPELTSGLRRVVSHVSTAPN